MNNRYPFHYEVRVKLLAFDRNNNVRNESFTKMFEDNTPLENRKVAFDEFNEYLSFILQIGRLKKNKIGNFYITQPSFVSEILNKAENTNDYYVFQKEFDQFKEEISVFLVVSDIEIAKNVIDAFEFEDKVENEFEIHKIASYSFEEQDIIDNLEMHELPLYEYYHIEVGSLSKTVFHYGLDYAESGEDEESGAKRTILKTPHIWDSIETYHDLYGSGPTEESNKVDNNIDFSSIIKKGENNQIEFKPCLLYNFKSGEGGISIKYVIAKAICGFLNSNGGVLFIGVNDNGNIQGLDYDYSLFKGENEKDKLLLELDSLLSYFFDISIKPLINSSIESIEGKDVLIVVVKESYKPLFLKNKRSGQIEKEMFIRLNASTRQITDNEEMVEYIFNKEWKKLNK